MRCLVTGAGGFIGGHLVEHLAGQGHDVYAMARRSTDVLRALGDRITVWASDITDRAEVGLRIGACGPERVYHLAAQSLPVTSWEAPARTFAVNVNGTLNLLDAVRAETPDALVVVACSSAEYEAADAGDPMDESRSLRPSSPYGVSKLAVDHVTRLYVERYGVRALRLRPFFLTGPRKEGDVSSDLARRIVAVERGEETEVRVGNTEVVRDILDIRDGLAAFDVAVNRGRAGEVYNVCSGHGYSVRELLDALKRFAKVRVQERVDPALIRPVDEKAKVGDPRRLCGLGWRAEYSLEDTMESLLDYWRARG